MSIKSFPEWLAEHRDTPGALGLAAQHAAGLSRDVYTTLVLLRATIVQFHRTPLGLAYARARRSYKAYVARRVERMCRGSI